MKFILLLCLALPIISYPPQAPQLVLAGPSQIDWSAITPASPASLTFNGDAADFVRAYPEICWNDRCVPTEALLTFIDQEGR